MNTILLVLRIADIAQHVAVQSGATSALGQKATWARV